MKSSTQGSGASLFGRITIANKLLLLTINAIIGVLLVTGFLLVQEWDGMLKERETSVKQAVETAYGTLAYYQGRVEKNEMSLEEAQKSAMDAVRTMRYGDDVEYFWINDMALKMVMHPIKPALDKTDLSDNKDPTGKPLFVNMVDIVKKQGAGFEFYMWPKPGNEAPVQKVSYVKGFVPWGWVIGSGVYIDTVDAAVWQQAKYAFLIAAAIGSLLFVIGLLVARSVTRPIKRAVEIAQQVAKGDLTSRIEVTSMDETGKLMQALKEMNENLVTIVTKVHSGTDTIATASGQIAAGNLDLSSRTEQQASSLEETASAMEELTSTVRQNADNARQANQLAQSAADIAEQGGQVVLQVVTSMQSIDNSSRKVSDIIAVIDGIAFQTNILALNAAVEAARAGEHGRGFAVVASEVRNLAQRSAAAAKEIKALIADSACEVDNGSRLVQQAGATMKDVVTSIKRVNGIMNEITAASKEQSIGIEQVNEAVAQMDQVTQQNAALVEEAAAAAESLREQASELSVTVGMFRLVGADRNARTVERSKPRQSSALSKGPAAQRSLLASRLIQRLPGETGVRTEKWEAF